MVELSIAIGRRTDGKSVRWIPTIDILGREFNCIVELRLCWSVFILCIAIYEH